MAHELNFDPQERSYPTPFLALEILSPDFVAIDDLWGIGRFHDLDVFDYGTYPATWEAPETQIPENLYAKMAPVLRLATILLNRVQPILVKIMFAPVEHPRYTFPQNWVAPAGMGRRWNRELRRIKDYYRILHASSQRLGTLAFTGTSANQRIDQYPVVGAISTEYLDTMNDAAFWNRDRHARHATWLSLASILLHELAHVIWNDRNIETIRDYSYRNPGEKAIEPLLGPTSTIRELGEEIENSLWGGRLHLPSDPNVQFDGSTGICLVLLPQSPHLFSAAGGRSIWWLTPETLAALLDRRLWEDGQVEVLKLDVTSESVLPRPLVAAHSNRGRGRLG